MVPKVAVLDAGAQLEGVIKRRVIEQGYEVTKFPVDISSEKLRGFDAIIISGGPRSVFGDNAMLPNPEIYKMGKPVLGICYGMQAIAHQLGGAVSRGERGQYGRSYVDFTEHGALFAGLDARERVLNNHFDRVSQMPPGFSQYAVSEGMLAAMGNHERRIYATQFHPEMIPITKKGQDIFRNFFLNICNFPELPRRTIDYYLDAAKRNVMQSVGADKRVYLYWSGGVDSTVMAIALSRWMEPDRLYIRTLKHPGMRKGETDEIKETAQRFGFKNFEVLDVRERMYRAMHMIETKKEGWKLLGPLWNTINPEHKRLLFGTEYAIIALQEIYEWAYELGIPPLDILLAQGTLKPDVITTGDERATMGKADTVKTHHNAVAILKLWPKLEPLIELFKDQVREAALAMGAPPESAYRQPFPGPGGYVRIVGHDGAKLPDNFMDLDAIVFNIARQRGFSARVLPIKTVGQQGDERSYKHPVVITGDMDWDALAKLAQDLPNEVSGINRVFYSPGKDITVEEATSMTKTLMTRDSIEQWQEADFVGREVLTEYGYNDSRMCDQAPGSLIPINFGVSGGRSYSQSLVRTKDFLSSAAMIPHSGDPGEDPDERYPEQVLLDIDKRVKAKVPGIQRTLFNLSDKPPTTTELE